MPPIKLAIDPLGKEMQPVALVYRNKNIGMEITDFAFIANLISDPVD
ncbi:hypothetical protein JW877_03190 [bacterium]|nr:hypothetical protein [bacterium]